MTPPAIVRARTLGCEMDGDVYDLVLVGESLYVLRLGAVQSAVDVAGLLKALHWAAVLYSKIGLRNLAGGHPDSSPGDAGAAIGRARLRVANATERQLLGLDAANLKAATTLVKAHLPQGAASVELRGIFVSAAEPAGRQRILRLDLAGDPAGSVERLLGMAGIPRI